MMTLADDVEDVISLRHATRLYFRHAPPPSELHLDLGVFRRWLSDIPRSVFEPV
jgi:hypothetical protein